MILGRQAILDALAQQEIVCDPMPTRVEGTHIDVTLGPHFFHSVAATGWMNGSDEFSAIDLTSVFPQFLWTPRFAHSDKVVFPPHSMTLCHTQEAIGSAVEHLQPCLETRSTLARHGLSVCTANAGWGDPGYVGIWTLEVVNHTGNWVSLPVGARVGSVSFTMVTGNDTLYEKEGRYNNTRDTWRPEMMLPRQFNF